MSPFHADYKVSQPYGCTGLPAEPAYGDCEHYHRGIDVVGPSATCPIYAVVPGVVYNCGTDSDGAKYVIELADTGNWICYWHLSAITVAKGRRLDTNTQIGNQGATGHATGNHLHLECHEPGTWLGLLKMTPTDPNRFIADQGGGSSMSTSTTDYLKHPDTFAEKIWVWVLAEAFQGYAWGTYPDDSADGYVKSIKAGASRGELAKEFATVGGWLAPADARALKDSLAAAQADAGSAHDHAVNLEGQLKDTQDKLAAALKPKPTPPQIDCQQKADAAVQAALANAEANPWPMLAAWIGKKLKIGGDR